MENEVQIQSLAKKLLSVYNACKRSTSKFRLRKKRYLRKTEELRFVETSELDTETETRCHQRNIIVFTQTLPTCGKLNTCLTDTRKTKSYSLLNEHYTTQSSTDFWSDSSYQWVCKCDSNTITRTYGNDHYINVCTCPSCCCRRKQRNGTLDKKSITEISGVKNSITVTPRSINRSNDKSNETRITHAEEIQVTTKNVDTIAAARKKKSGVAQTASTALLGCECNCERNRRSIACQSSPTPCRECSTLTLVDPPTQTNISINKSNTSCSCQCEAPILDVGRGCQCCSTGPGESCRRNCQLTPNKKCCCNKVEQGHSKTSDIQADRLITPTKYSNEDAVPSRNVSMILSDDMEVLHDSNNDLGQKRQYSSRYNTMAEEAFNRRAVEGVQNAPPIHRSKEVNVVPPYIEDRPLDSPLKSCECRCPRCRGREKINGTQTPCPIFESQIRDYHADVTHCLRRVPINLRFPLSNEASEIGTIDEAVNTFNNVIVQTYTSATVEQLSSQRFQPGSCQEENGFCTCGKRVLPEKEIASENFDASQRLPNTNSSPSQFQQLPSRNSTNMQKASLLPSGHSTQSAQNQQGQQIYTDDIRSQQATALKSSRRYPQTSNQIPPLTDSLADPGRKAGGTCCCCSCADDVIPEEGDGDGEQFPGLNDETKDEIRDLLRTLEEALLKESRLHKKNMTTILKQLGKQGGEIKELKIHVKGIVDSKRAVTCEAVEKKLRKMDETKRKDERKRKRDAQNRRQAEEDAEPSTCCKCDKKKRTGCCAQCCANRCCGCCGTCCGGCCINCCDCCCGPCEKICPCCCACADCCDTCCSCSCFSSGKTRKCKCR